MAEEFRPKDWHRQIGLDRSPHLLLFAFECDFCCAIEIAPLCISLRVFDV